MHNKQGIDICSTAVMSVVIVVTAKIIGVATSAVELNDVEKDLIIIDQNYGDAGLI